MAVDISKLISVITPCFNEEDNVEECYREVKETFEQSLQVYEYEHIFCDNSSTDSTVERLRAIAAKDKHVKVIVNARNFGPFRSTFNGLMNTHGNAVVVLLAADLQDPPALIVDFVKKWEEGFEIVYGIRANREEGIVMRNVRKLFYRIVNRFADFYIPPDVSEFQLIDRVVVEALAQFDDHYPYMRGMIASCGFSSYGIKYTWTARKRGFSKNRLYHLFDQGINGLISFTNVPLRISLVVGFIISCVSVIYSIVQLLINLVFLGKLAPPGIPTLIVAIFFFGGVQLFFLGIIGEYLSATHFQVRKRPLVVEKERINF